MSLSWRTGPWGLVDNSKSTLILGTARVIAGDLQCGDGCLDAAGFVLGGLMSRQDEEDVIERRLADFHVVDGHARVVERPTTVVARPRRSEPVLAIDARRE